jgi:GDP-L-fucose synthase
MNSFFGSQKFVVTGGLGFLGRAVVSSLRSRGASVEVCSRRTGVDIRELAQIKRYLSDQTPDIVINCAAHVGGIAYNAKYPVPVYEDNLLLGLNLIRALAECGVRKLVNVMPNCTYPGEAEIYREGEWWDGPMHPTVLTYGLPRKALWVQAWAYQGEKRLESIHLVLPNLYGPHDHFDILKSHALGALVRKIVDAKFRGENRVEIWGTGRPVREWMYVEDAADGIVVAAEKWSDLDILNLGSGEGCSIQELAEMIKGAAGWDGEFVYDASRPDGAPSKVLDVTKMKDKLGWFPKVSLTKGIPRTVAWYIEHRQEYL